MNKTFKSIVKYGVFPLVLVLFPLIKVSKGIDLTDTAYSLGNYKFFGDSKVLWTYLTYLANVVGKFLTLLPTGNTMLGMKVYCSLIVSVLALLGYRFYLTKMPCWIAFVGEMAAIGLCWCPTVILYNYLTYLLFLLGVIFLFRGLAGARPGCLILAGVVLGVNTFVRFPNNGLEVLLILAVWYYGFICNKSVKEITGETLRCILGYAIGFLAIVIVMSINYGLSIFGTMISGVISMSGSASDYTFGQMLLSILSAYGHGMKWLSVMVLCVLPGIPFLMLQKDFYPKLRKVVYIACIAFLFFVLAKWGMFNLRYFQKESALQWGAVFLIVSIGICLWMIFSSKPNTEWRLIGALSFIIILITPLGSNNYIWPALNNLFFIAPMSFWMIFRFAKWGREYLDAGAKVPLFSLKAMMSAICIMFFIQTIGVGIFYVFLDGEFGEEVAYQVKDNTVLQGMKTTEGNAKNLSGITEYMNLHANEFGDRNLILYGNIPGLSYYLDKPTAIYTSWPDLDTNSIQTLKTDLQNLDGVEGDARPIVIITPPISAYMEGNEELMNFWSTDAEKLSADPKWNAIMDFMQRNHYVSYYGNEAFVVYE